MNKDQIQTWKYMYLKPKPKGTLQFPGSSEQLP